MASVLVAALIGCGGPRGPAVRCPEPAVAVASEPAIAPEDDALRRWKAIAATDVKRPPAGVTAGSLVPELVAYLRSPDPVRRDSIGFEVLMTWLRAGVLTDPEATALAHRLLDGLGTPLAEPGGVFGRSFTMLVLAEVMRRESKSPFLSADDRATILRAAVEYANRETDLRGHTGATGWAHAAAHTGDLLWRIANVPSYTDEDRGQILHAVESLVVRRHGQILAYGEDGRLGVAVVAAVHAGVAAPAIDAFLTTLRAPLVEPGSPTFDAGLFASQRNARNLLFTLYVQLSTIPTRTAGEDHLLAGIQQLLTE